MTYTVKMYVVLMSYVKLKMNPCKSEFGIHVRQRVLENKFQFLHLRKRKGNINIKKHLDSKFFH